MKHFYALLGIAAIVCAVSCSKDEGGISKMESAESELGLDPREIKFAVGDGTKAFSETTTASLQTSGFNAIILMNNSTVYEGAGHLTHNGTVYKYSKKVYYPGSGTLYVYAINGSATTLMPYQGTGDDKCIYVDITQNPDQDLVYCKQSFTQTSGTVALTMTHILSQVKFNLTAGDSSVNYFVKTISVTSSTSNKFRFDTAGYSNGDLSSKTTHWSNASGVQVATSGTDIGDPKSYIPALAGSESTHVQIEITWECRSTSDGSVIATYTKSGSLNLDMGKINTIKATLSNSAANELQFTATVSDWGANVDKNVTLS